MSDELIAALTAIVTLLGLRVEYSNRQLGKQMDSLAKDVASVRDPDLKEVRNDTRKLTTMHQHPDDYGFGSREVNAKVDRMFGEQTKMEVAISELCEVVKSSIATSEGLMQTIRDSMLQRSKLMRSLEEERER